MKKKWYSGYFTATTAIVVFALVYCILFAHSDVTGLLISEMNILSDGEPWNVIGGEGVSTVQPGTTLEGIGSTLTIEKTIDPEQLQKTVLLFQNNRQCVTVRVDGEEIYNLGAGPRRYRFGTSCLCTVRLPEHGAPYELQISFSHLEGGRCILPELSFGNEGEVVRLLCRMDCITLLFFPFSLAFIILLCGAFLAAKHYCANMKKLVSAASFWMWGGVYLLAELNILALTSVNREMISFICFYILMIIPSAALYYVRTLCDTTPKGYYPILAIECGNVIVQTALFLTGVFSLYQMSILSQLLLLGIAIYGIGVLLKARSALPDRRKKLILWGIVTALLADVMAVIFFWWNNSKVFSPQNGYQLAITIMLTAMLIDAMFTLRDQVKAQKAQETRMEADQRALLVDSLTGVGSRRAFDNALQAVEDAPERYPDPVLVYMDLEGLKYVNDTYGRAVGDELLISAANCIRAGFEGAGEVFRTNDDDFAVILEKRPDVPGTYLKKMDAAIAAVNAEGTASLTVFRGCSHLCENGVRRTIEEWKALAEKQLYADRLSKRTPRMGISDDYMQLISGFVSAVDAKDPYTANHSKRVGEIAKKICVLLGLSEQTTNEIEMAARLHDIGKIGIPDAVLTKPGKLSEEEWATMKTHPEMGESIVKCIRSLYEVSQIIRHHHERVDGGGYPDGLSGDAIPLGSRILMIADSIDAILSRRVYRDSLSPEQCREQIRINLGLMYDRTIGQIVLDHWEEFERF